jgi:phosphopantothenoylcysteine decarboxylase/phosphopantothenate--cysteine ligase
MKNKNILVVVTGSIAAYKTCDVIRLLRKEGAEVQVMMTRAAQEFVGKTTFAALTNHEVITEMFTRTPKAGLEHIKLAIDLDAVVVIPATENMLCKVANGVADEVASTTLSICEQPTLFAPAMNFRMWHNPATMEAVEKLLERGKKVLDPEEGALASLHEGEGRLPDIKIIMNGIRSLFDIPLPLKGKRILITAGPTREAIDIVRYISNRSSGKMGFALAECARDMGATIILVSGPVALPDIPEVKIVKVESAKEMECAVLRNCSKADYIFMAAAVADYMPTKISEKKIKRSNEILNLNLFPTPDILKSIQNKTKAIITAFALETHNGEQEAKRKMREKNTDFIVLNYANEQGAGFNSNTNHVTIFNKKGISKELKKDRKDRIAKKIIEHIIISKINHK